MSNPKTGIATIADVQAACGLGRDATRAAVIRGELPAKKINGKYVARWEWINAWIAGKPGFWNTPVHTAPPATNEPIPFTPNARPRRAS